MRMTSSVGAISGAFAAAAVLVAAALIGQSAEKQAAATTRSLSPAAGSSAVETTGNAAATGPFGGSRFPPRTFLNPTQDVDPAAVNLAHQERMSGFPPAQPIDPNATWTTAQQAIDAARLFAQSPDSPTAVLPDSERERLPATAVLVRYQELADSFLGGAGAGGDPDISTDRPVWVVVVRGTIRNDSMMYGESTDLATHDVYTVVYDAPTSALIMYAAGGDAFASGLKPVSTVEHHW